MKRFFKGLVFDYFIIHFGIIISAIGIGIFLVPGQLVTSGVPGVATIFYYGFHIPIGATILALNIPIFLLGVKVFGKNYGFKTLFGIIGLAFYTQLFQTLLNNSSIVDYTKGGNLLLAPIFGGLFLGSGMGIIFKFGGSMGGADILGQVINYFTPLSLPHSILILDITVMGSGILFFGVEKGLYAILSAFVCNLSLQKVFDGISRTKILYITTTKEKEVIEIINENLGKENPTMDIYSLHGNSDKKLITTIIKSKKLRDLQVFIKRIDSEATIVINEVFPI